jgi:hypothetical protein
VKRELAQAAWERGEGAPPWAVFVNGSKAGSTAAVFANRAGTSDEGDESGEGEVDHAELLAARQWRPAALHEEHREGLREHIMPAHVLPGHAAVPPPAPPAPPLPLCSPPPSPAASRPPLLLRPLRSCPLRVRPSFVSARASCPLKLRAQVPHGHADGFLPGAIFPDWSAHRPRWRYNGYPDFDLARYPALASGAAAEPASASALARLVGAGESGLAAALLHAVGLRRRSAGPGEDPARRAPPKRQRSARDAEIVAMRRRRSSVVAPEPAPPPPAAAPGGAGRATTGAAAEQAGDSAGDGARRGSLPVGLAGAMGAAGPGVSFRFLARDIQRTGDYCVAFVPVGGAGGSGGWSGSERGDGSEGTSEKGSKGSETTSGVSDVDSDAERDAESDTGRGLDGEGGRRGSVVSDWAD